MVWSAVEVVSRVCRWIDSNLSRIAPYLRVEPKFVSWVGAFGACAGLVTLFGSLTLLSSRPQVRAELDESFACFDLLEFRRSIEEYAGFLQPYTSTITCSLMSAPPAYGPNSLISQVFEAKKWAVMRHQEREIDCWFDPSRTQERELQVRTEYDAYRAIVSRQIATSSIAEARLSREMWARPRPRELYKEPPINALVVLQQVMRMPPVEGSTRALGFSEVLGPFTGGVEINALAEDPIPDYVKRTGVSGYTERWLWDLLLQHRTHFNRVRLVNMTDEFAEVSTVVDAAHLGVTRVIAGNVPVERRGTSFYVRNLKLFPGEERVIVLRTSGGRLVDADLRVYQDPTLRPSRPRVLLFGLLALALFLLIVYANIRLARSDPQRPSTLA